MKNKGFTLIEIIVVISIIGILLMITVPKGLAYKEDAKRIVYLNDANTIYTAATTYTNNNTELINNNIGNSLFYPLSEEELGNYFTSDITIVDFKNFDMKSEDKVLVFTILLEEIMLQVMEINMYQVDTLI